jgi:mannitol-1-phosphate 5-dehydrogenase
VPAICQSFSTCFLLSTCLHSSADSGRGFIGPLLSSSGYHVTFIDVQEHIIDALNDDDEYPVQILDKDTKSVTIHDFDALKTDDPSVPDVIATATIVTTSVGPKVLDKIAPVIAKGISKHREKSESGESRELTIIACENMVGATSHLEENVRKALTEDSAFSDADMKHLERSIGFANCEVDRIVPAFDGDNPLEVGVEAFYEWTVERGNVKGELNIKGMKLEDDLTPFLERKLYTLNCGHATLAFLGYVKGYKVLQDAIADESIRSITRKALEESGAALVKKHSFDPEQHKKYIDRTMSRFANPNLHDDIVRVLRNPIRKLSPKERLVGAVDNCREQGDLPRDHLLMGIGAAFHFDDQDDEEALLLMEKIKEKGIETTVEETTKFKKGSQDYEAVLKHYHTTKKWKESAA